MVATPQYPQYLYAMQHEAQAKQNPDTGSWETLTAIWELKGICREETDGKGQSVQTGGGEATVFSSIVCLPQETPRISEGTQVAITREKVKPDDFLSSDFMGQGKISGLIVASGKCMKYDAGRLHCRLWI
jgi:hypothetical protein